MILVFRGLTTGYWFWLHQMYKKSALLQAAFRNVYSELLTSACFYNPANWSSFLAAETMPSMVRVMRVAASSVLFTVALWSYTRVHCSTLPLRSALARL